MKKIFLMMIALTMALVIVTACGDDKDEPEKYNDSPIVGTWREAVDDNYYVHFVFNNDGKGLAQECKIENGVIIGVDEWKMSYVYNSKNKTLTMKISERTYKYDVDLLSATQLILNDGNQVEIYTRVI